MAAPLVWALIDDRPGTAGQVLGLAEKLGFPFTVKHVRYRFLARLPNRLWPNGVAGIDLARSDPLQAPWPDLVISAGRRTAPVAQWTKRQSPAAYLAHIMHPDMALEGFDAVILPRHDHPPALSNVMTVEGALHRLTPAKLAEAKAAFSERLSTLPPPYTAVLVGGTTKHGAFTREDIDALIHHVSAIRNGGSLLVTVSRRTAPKLTQRLKEKLPPPAWMYEGVPAEENPYQAFLGAADQIIVTGDSISMMTEAAVTGKPVYVFMPRQAASAKHRLAMHQFEQAGRVKRVRLFDPAWRGGESLDEAVRVAEKIHRDIAST